MQLLFGIGALWGQRTDAPGLGPDQFAILQDNSIDFQFELKELYSQLQFPIDIARGKGKINGKAKAARVAAALYADIFFGANYTTGESTVSESEPYTLATNTLSVAHAGTNYIADLGVYYTGNAAQKAFTYTTAAPTAAGQYTINGSGGYSFYTGDIGQAIGISYVYTDNNGKTITITNQFMGYTPMFSATFYQQRNTQGSTGQLTLRLNQCVSSHFTFPSRLDDYAIPDFDYQAFSNSAGAIGTLSTSE